MATNLDSLSSSQTSSNETIYKTLSIPFKRIVNTPIHTISVDATGKFLALGGKKGLYFIDLDQSLEPSKTFTQQTKWEASVIEWNPHISWKGYIASSANQNTQIWNLDDSNGVLQSTLQTHTRAVSDISWSLFEPNILATCSADTFINLWDIRDPKKPIKFNSFCGWTAGATQVKWNRLNKLILASAHNGEVRIWDIRKVSSPVTFITAHMAKIYGLDWSYISENDLVTCSEDKQVKIWDINSPRNCKGTLQSGTPSYRAKYTPFGSGIVTMAQRTDFTLRLWNVFDTSNPIRQFSGHSDIVTAFDWRIQEKNGSKEYQLISWSKDNELRMWYMDKKIIESVSSKSSTTLSISTNSKGPSVSPSVSPVDSFASSIQDLVQEFSLIQKNKPKGVIIEETNLIERTCTISLAEKPIRMKISFPVQYPNSTPPIFQFISGTNAPQQIQSSIIEILTEKARSYVEINKPCLTQCLTKLVSSLRDFSEEDDFVSQLELNNTIVSSPDDKLPCPRASRAVFGGTGSLIYFNNFRSSGRSPSLRFRTYRDLKTHTQNENNPSEFPVQEEVPSFSTSTFFYSPQAFTKDFKHTPLMTSPSSAELDTSVSIRDLSQLMPINKTLAENYMVLGKKISEICNHNKEVAKNAHRPDLVQLWSYLATIVHPSVYFEDKSQRTQHWVHHPLTKKLLITLFNHYKKLYDIQTLAIMACILDVPPEHNEITINYNHNFSLNLSSSKIPPPKQSVTFLDSENLPQLNQFRKYYSDILYRWGFQQQQAEVMKFVRHVTINIPDLQFSIFCTTCQQFRDGIYCRQCRKLTFRCVICNCVVKGISSFCVNCGHGGHSPHLANWFEKETKCPTGCGCTCVSFTESKDS